MFFDFRVLEKSTILLLRYRFELNTGLVWCLEENNGTQEGGSANHAGHLESGSAAASTASGGGSGARRSLGAVGLVALVPGSLCLVLGLVKSLLISRALGKAQAGIGHVGGVGRGVALVSKSQRLHEVGVGRVLGKHAGEHLVADILFNVDDGTFRKTSISRRTIERLSCFPRASCDIQLHVCVFGVDVVPLTTKHLSTQAPLGLKG